MDRAWTFRNQPLYPKTSRAFLYRSLNNLPIPFSIPTISVLPEIHQNHSLTLSINIAQKPYIIGSLGPEALEYESFEGKGYFFRP